MTNNFENEMWESLLKAAVIKNSLDELENYPQEEITEIKLPAHYDQKMKKLVQRLHYQTIARSALYYAKKAAAAFFILIGISFIFLLYFDEVRATCHNVITHIYEKYIQFNYISDLDDEMPSIKLEYIPDGFSLAEEITDDLNYDVSYTNPQTGMLYFQATITKHTFQTDNEHYNIHDVNINNYTGKYFESTDEYFPNILYWQTENIYCTLQAPLPEEEMIKIAENVK